jgi:hypothetical protein
VIELSRLVPRGPEACQRRGNRSCKGRVEASHDVNAHIELAREPRFRDRFTLRGLGSLDVVVRADGSKDIRHGAFLYVPATEAQLSRAVDIDAAYPALDLGLVDASIVALAEELGVTRLLTRDVRDFSTVRLGDGRAFDLVVSPTRPEPAMRQRRRES